MALHCIIFSKLLLRFLRKYASAASSFIINASYKKTAYWVQSKRWLSAPKLLLVVISPEMTYKTGQIYVRPSVRPCGVNIFITDRWHDVDETWHVYLWVGGHNF